jgi:hypothetical protein
LFEIAVPPKPTQREAQTIDLHLAAILLNRFEPLAPHHVGWIRERLKYKTDEELREYIIAGKELQYELS